MPARSLPAGSLRDPVEFIDLEYHVRARLLAGNIGHRFLADVHPAELFHRLARTQVVAPDLKNDPIDKLEGVIEHQLFERTVVAVRPTSAHDEGVAHRHLALAFVEIVITRTADQLAIDIIDDAQGTAGLHATFEVAGEYLALVAILGRMLFPDERIGGHGV